MNSIISPAAEIALRKHVERAVRPVLAREQRKLRMREELLAHLTAIFVEEQERLRDEVAALAMARERFGEPAELTAELNHGVSRWQRLAAVGEQWERRLQNAVNKGNRESWPRYALRCLLASALLVVGIYVTVLGLFWCFGVPLHSEQLVLLPRIAPAMIVGYWFAIMAIGWANASTATGGRRWRGLIFQSALWSLLLTGTDVCLWWSLDRLLHPSEIALEAMKIWAFVAGTLVFFTVVVDHSRHLRRLREAWTLLEIDE